MNKVGIIGLGHMGQAMVAGFQKSKIDQMVIGYHFDAKQANELTNKLKIKVLNNYQEFINEVEMILIAVRPNQIDGVVQELDQFDLKDKIIISIISGLKINQLKEKFHQEVKVVRALPNLNAAQRMSATGIQFDQLMNEKETEKVLECLNKLGKTYQIAEAQFSAFTVVAGCTPAYFFKIVDAIYQSGVKNGLADELSLELAMQSGIGSLTTLINSGKKPKEMVDAVCVPNGITIEGINYLDEHDFDGLIDQAIKISIAKDLKGQGRN